MFVKKNTPKKNTLKKIRRLVEEEVESVLNENPNFANNKNRPKLMDTALEYTNDAAREIMPQLINLAKIAAKPNEDRYSDPNWFVRFMKKRPFVVELPPLETGELEIGGSLQVTSPKKVDAQVDMIINGGLLVGFNVNMQGGLNSLTVGLPEPIQVSNNTLANIFATYDNIGQTATVSGDISYKFLNLRGSYTVNDPNKLQLSANIGTKY